MGHELFKHFSFYRRYNAVVGVHANDLMSHPNCEFDEGVPPGYSAKMMKEQLKVYKTFLIIFSRSMKIVQCPTRLAF
jgi:hypothetical protein